MSPDLFNLEKFKADALYRQGDPEANRQFEKAFASWWATTLRAAKGARLLRLKSGLTYASMYFLRFTWFPAFGSLKGLIPEYEVEDYKDGFRYIDFVYFTNAYRVAIEVDGRASHRMNATPAEYEDELTPKPSRHRRLVRAASCLSLHPRQTQAVSAGAAADARENEGGGRGEYGTDDD
ncbi:hypothetical protein [Cohnella sp. GCM10012308]|uniref:hypothetical protein n=1 Tax=Cohnella sp. GCM10012308 TaxID=3317329 RepID=UPI00362143EF